MGCGVGVALALGFAYHLARPTLQESKSSTGDIMTVEIIERFALEQLGRGKTARRRKLASRRRSLRGEMLEGRQMLSLVTQPLQVNSTTARDQYEVASASAPDGSSVTVWTHEYSSSNSEIYAQRLNAAGLKVGREIRVATTSRNEHSPDVTMSANGDFVVAWAYDHSNSDTDIRAQRFNASGLKRGGVIHVSSSSRDEARPSIAAAGNGDFVVVWTQEYSESNRDIRGRRYGDDGRALGPTFRVATSRDNETHPDVARSPDGRFAVSYQHHRDNGDVIVSRYSVTGTLVSTHTVAAGSPHQTNPRLAIDEQANVVVVWQEGAAEGSKRDFDIMARQIDNLGQLGLTITVSTSFDQEVTPDVAVRRDGGIFVVTFQNSTRSNTTIAEMTRSGFVRNQQVVAAETQLLEPAAITFGVGDSYSVSYAQMRSSGSTEIFARRGVVTPTLTVDRLFRISDGVSRWLSRFKSAVLRAV